MTLLDDDQGNGIICPRCGHAPGPEEAVKILRKERKREDSSVR